MHTTVRLRVRNQNKKATFFDKITGGALGLQKKEKLPPHYSIAFVSKRHDLLSKKFPHRVVVIDCLKERIFEVREKFPKVDVIRDKRHPYDVVPVFAPRPSKNETKEHKHVSNKKKAHPQITGRTREQYLYPMMGLLEVKNGNVYNFTVNIL